MDNLISHENAFDFIFGGRGNFTMINDDTGNQFSYKITQSSNKDNCFYVKVKRKNMDTDEKESYYYAGSLFLKNEKDNFNCIYVQGKNGKLPIYDKKIQSLIYVIKKLHFHELRESVKIYHHCRCARCGKLLTDAESIERGFGKECWKIMLSEKD